MSVATSPVAVGKRRRISRWRKIFIAALVLSPEGFSAIDASLRNQLQRSINILFGSVLATIGLTIPIALAGVIPVKVTCENGAIHAGDLLVSSSLPGRAMHAPANPQPGTVLGKAMRALTRDSGEIDMLVMLR